MAQALARGQLIELPGTVHRSKITPPRPAPVRRPALARRLEEAAAGRLTLVVAPAGWGKSSALAEWAAQTALPVAWLCCDESDNNPTRFVRALVTAVERARPGAGLDLFAMLRSSSPMPAGHLLETFAASLADDPLPMAVVLDDFHLIGNPELLAAVEELLATIPDNLHLVIASRVRPPWSLARWRAYGDVHEFGPEDLAFTEADIVAMVGDGVLDEATIRALRERSEGWVAGIRLALLWMERFGPSQDLLARFHGTQRDVADYLAEEVFDHLPGGLRRFLLQTSVLDHFSAPLALAVSGNDNAASLLEQIEAQGLFLVPMDHERRWYRYHGIFREFLLERLQREAAVSAEELYRRAAEWLIREGATVEAVEYLLRASEPDRAAALLNESAERLLLQQGETHTLVRYVERLPDGTRHAFPTLERFYAWALVLTGRMEEATALADELERSLPEDEEHANLRRAEIASIRSRIAAYRADHEGTIAHGEQALQLANGAADWFRADVLLSLGFAHRAMGHIEQAAQLFSEASRLGWQSGLVHAACWGSRYQAVTYVSQGRLHDAALLIEENMARARSEGLDHGAAFAALLVGRGELRYERNDLRGARKDLEQALRLAQQVGDAKILMNVYVALALLQHAEGRPDEARATIRRGIQIFDGPTEKALEAWLALRRGDLPAVRRWVEWYRSTEGSMPSLSCGETEQVMFGRGLLALGQVDEAIAFLTVLLREAEETGRWGRAIVVRMILAVAADERGDESTASAHLVLVLDLAMRERYVRTILDEGPALLRLLRRYARSDDDPDRRRYVASLLGWASRADDDAGAPVAPTGLVEPLTDRQLEILALMAEGRSNREIADALFLAEGTVKAHLHQIFGKLMVRNRAEAIRAARELRLIS